MSPCGQNSKCYFSTQLKRTYPNKPYNLWQLSTPVEETEGDYDDVCPCVRLLAERLILLLPRGVPQPQLNLLVFKLRLEFRVNLDIFLVVLTILELISNTVGMYLSGNSSSLYRTCA